VVVVEGAARDAVDAANADVEVVAAPGEGDDEIVARASAAVVTGHVVVVTADRELRRRCEEVGARPVGPRWLTGLLSVAD
jgi:rRNA-processing protein FCF1